METSAWYLHQINPFVIEFPKSFFIEGIRWYGLAYFVSFLILYYSFPRFQHWRSLALTKEMVSSLMIAFFCGVLLGGHVGYVLFYEEHFFPIQWNKGIYGMSSHGGMLGCVLAVFCFTRRYRVSLFCLSDVLVSIAPVGLFFGRIANFINGELFGRVSFVPWAVRFPLSVRYGTPVENILPRHPSQIYEALGEGLFLLIYFQWRLRRTNSPGIVTSEFFIFYALIRIFLEVFREPDAPLIGFLTRGQFYSVFLLFFGLFLKMKAVKDQKRQNVSMP